MLGDYAEALAAIETLARATLTLRDELLARHGLTTEVVRLEDAGLSLQESLATLRAAVDRSQGEPRDG